MRILLPVIALLCGRTLCLADTVTLTTGETLKGTIVEQTSETVTLKHPILGRVVLKLGDVAASTRDTPSDGPSEAAPPAADAPAAAEATTKPPPPAPAEGAKTAEGAKATEGANTTTVAALAADAEPTSLFKLFVTGWDGRIDMGLSGTQGNSDTANLHFGFRLKKENEERRIAFRSQYDYAVSDGDTSRNQLNARLTHDWLLQNSPWFYFVKGIYDYDQFTAWDHRVSGFGGFGYQFVKSDRLDLIGRIGGGLTVQFGGADDVRPEGLVSGSVVKWKLTDSQSIQASSTMHPDLSELGEFRILANVEWLLKINQADGVSLKIGVENEYESITDDDSKHNDQKYYGALVFEF